MTKKKIVEFLWRLLPFYMIMFLLLGNMLKSDVSNELLFFWGFTLLIITFANIEPIIKDKD
jgi:hypothetical protein